MALSESIKRNMESLLDAWEAFAADVQPEAGVMTREELRDLARQMLEAIADDMREPQSDVEQEEKSKGRRPNRARRLTEAARDHAMERLAQGFGLRAMVSEYRALRATVTREWTREMGGADRDSLDELVRFNEALDQALIESVDRYSQRLEQARDLFVGALTHDLRSPLATVSSSAELLLASSERLESQDLKVVVRLRNATARMGKLIADLTDFTRTRLGGLLPIIRRRTNFSDVCRHVADELSPVHPDREVLLNCGKHLLGDWDSARLEQMTNNLLSNALKYSPPGSPVTVTARGEKDELVFTVHNEGEPIPEKLLPMLFEPMAQGALEDRRENREGLGLGLYIAQQIVVAHRGVIRVRSTKEEGTTFEVRLPWGAQTSTAESSA